MGSKIISAVPYVGSGIREDITRLCEQYKAANTLDIDVFWKLFRTNEFDKIYFFRETEAELVEFSEVLLTTAAKCFREKNERGDVNSLNHRVFGVYMTYALYHLQFYDHVCQARATIDQLDELLDLEKQLSDMGQKLAVECIHILIRKNAFTVSLSKYSYDPATHRREMHEDDLHVVCLPFKTSDPTSSLESIIKSNLFQELSFIHSHYVQAKNSLGINDRSISMINSKNPMEECTKILEKHQELWKKEQEEEQLQQAEASTDNGSVKTTGSTRKNARQKAYSSEIQHARHRRYADPNMDDNFARVNEGGMEGNNARKSTKAKTPRTEPTEPESSTETPVDEVNMIGMKSSKRGNISSKIRAPVKKKSKLDGELDKQEKIPTTSPIKLSISPKKKTQANKSALPSEWNAKLSKLSRKEAEADRLLEKLKSEISLDAD